MAPQVVLPAPFPQLWSNQPMPLFDAYVFVDWSAKHGLLPRQPTADVVGPDLAGKIYNGQACVCAYMMSISTTSFYYLICG
jgi:hypothetical protein